MAMTNRKMNELGARLMGEKVSDGDSTLAKIGDLLPLSDSYRQALNTIGGGIFFDNGATFTPDSPIPWAGSDGKLNIEMLFGLGRGEHSLLKNLDTFKDDIPEGGCPIGDDVFGNLVCADEYGEVFFWDHETGRVYGVAPGLDDFFSRLEPAPEE